MVHTNNSHRHLLHTLVFIVCTILGSDSIARSKDDDTKATGAIDAATFEVLTTAQELTEGGKYGQA